MTRWGLLLLVVFLFLGLRRGEMTNAVRAVVWVTVGVLLFAAVKAGAL
jgi:hypothetical protein